MSIILLCALTARSQAFAQTLRDVGLSPTRCLTYGTGLVSPPPVTRPIFNSGEVFTPNFEEPLLDTLSMFACPHEHLSDCGINDPAVAAALDSGPEDLVVFSGYPGEIVRAPLINAGIQILHMHTGALPGYRGSTTFYYAILNGDDITVTALLLNAGIDTGKVVYTKTYPRPMHGTDLDRHLDPIIRADTLRDVVELYENGQMTASPQPTEGRTYFVIHPVLRAIAANKLQDGKTS